MTRIIDTTLPPPPDPDEPTGCDKQSDALREQKNAAPLDQHLGTRACDTGGTREAQRAADARQQTRHITAAEQDQIAAFLAAKGARSCAAGTAKGCTAAELEPKMTAKDKMAGRGGTAKGAPRDAGAMRTASGRKSRARRAAPGQAAATNLTSLDLSPVQLRDVAALWQLTAHIEKQHPRGWPSRNYLATWMELGTTKIQTSRQAYAIHMDDDWTPEMEAPEYEIAEQQDEPEDGANETLLSMARFLISPAGQVFTAIGLAKSGAGNAASRLLSDASTGVAVPRADTKLLRKALDAAEGIAFRANVACPKIVGTISPIYMGRDDNGPEARAAQPAMPAH